MIALLGVAVLAVAGVVVTVLSSVAATRPDRAAMAVVLAVAAGGAVFAVLALAGFGLVGAPTGENSAAYLTRTGEPVVVATVPPLRRTLGLGGAAVLLASAAGLVRSTDWSRPDDRPE